MANKTAKEWPGVEQIRSQIDEESRIKAILPGLATIVVPLIIWIATFIGIIFLPWWAKIILGVVNGLTIAVMFLSGHDAAHGSLFPKRWMNRLAGSMSLLPALHPYSAWVHTHNGLHHGFTNIKEKDPGFPPLNHEEYKKLSFLGRLSYRVGRTWYGMAWLYFKDMWIKWEFFPDVKRAPKNPKAFLRDRIKVTLFALSWIGGLAWASVETEQNLWLLLGCGFFLPQFVWNWFIGFIIFQQHTHPRVAWYSELDSPSPVFFQLQLHATPHIIFPFIARFIMRNIMEHTAHHVDPSVPLYCLSEAQKALEHSYRREIVRILWSPLSFLKVLRTCKIYDYASHRWLDYDGNPMTESLYESYLVNIEVEEKKVDLQSANS